MNMNRAVLLLVVIVITGLGLGILRGYSQEQRPVSTTTVQKWDYMVLIPDENGPDKHDERRMRLELQLQQVGNDGWELVTVPYLKGVRYQVLVFKRPKQ